MKGCALKLGIGSENVCFFEQVALHYVSFARNTVVLWNAVSKDRPV